MTDRTSNFCYWLAGFQRTVTGSPTPAQWAEIMKKLTWVTDKAWESAPPSPKVIVRPVADRVSVCDPEFYSRP